MGRLTGKVAVITGASAGIGKATAELFAAEGAALVITDWKSEGIEALAASVNAAGGRATAIRSDVRSHADVKKVIEHAMATYGRIDVLVNNAGISDLHMSAINTEDQLWDNVLATDLSSTFYFCKETLPHMVEAGQGSIVNVGSIGGVYMCAGVAYSAAKAGVNGLTRNIALQYAGTGIRCNSVNPGPTDTGMITPESMKDFDMEFVELSDKHLYLEAGMCDPIDQARAILFFASDESRYITGQFLVVDRGVCL